MYEKHFGFHESPFGVAAHPRFFYTNSSYQVAFAALLYGIESKKGLMLLTGEVGTGKTTLLHKLMKEFDTAVKPIFLFSTYLSFDELVRFILQDLPLDTEGKGALPMFHKLERRLLHQLNNGHTVALLVDEAQNLSDESLEGLRSLSNLEADSGKLLQIVLAGQQELDEKLNKPSTSYLKQRIAIRCRLNPLTQSEVQKYIRHRLQVAGYDGPEIFSGQAIESIWGYSRGTPRLINTLCDNALVVAYEASRRTVSADIITDVARDLGLEPERQVVNVEVRGTDRKTEDALNDYKERGKSKRDDELEQSDEVEGSNGVEESDEVERLSVDTPESPLQPAHQIPPQDTVPPQFFHRLARALAEAMGPMASVVIADQISALDESLDAFPKRKLVELIDSVSVWILNEEMKAHFQHLMWKETLEIR